MRYRVQHRIATLSSMAIIRNEKTEDSFEAEGIRFSPWDLSVSGRYRADFWMAESDVEANTVVDAIGRYWPSMVRIVTRLALVTQAYIEAASQPFLIAKDGADVAWLRYTKQKRGVGLHFTVGQLDALNSLLVNASIPNEFFYYWTEAVDTPGYTAKILLMPSAVEAWAKRLDREQWWQVRAEILGGDLDAELFESGGQGLRHRLVHGEFFRAEDTGKNYPERIHRAVLSYFNRQIFARPLLPDDVVNPQRHPSGSREGVTCFIRSRGAALTLRAVVEDFEANGINGLRHHALDYDQRPEEY